MNADFPVVLDACVLANQRVTDLLLRLSETPRLFLPKWSGRILEEVDKTLVEKLGWPDSLAAYRRQQMTNHFGEALVEGFEPIESCLENDPKDRHVLAAAISAKCEIIVTFNLKHFPADALNPWGIEAHHPSKFLENLYSLNQGLVVQRLNDIGAVLEKTTAEVISELSVHVRPFAIQVATDIGFEV